jgi:hypothetical protein
MSHEIIPWMNQKEQPKSAVDILPLCFFQLISIDEEDGHEEIKIKQHNYSYQHSNLITDNIYDIDNQTDYKP